MRVPNTKYKQKVKEKREDRGEKKHAVFYGNKKMSVNVLKSVLINVDFITKLGISDNSFHSPYLD